MNHPFFICGVYFFPFKLEKRLIKKKLNLTLDRNQNNEFSQKKLKLNVLKKIEANYHLDKLFFFIHHIYLRNLYSNLVSKNSQNNFYEKHILDSLTAGIVLKTLWSYQNKFCIDVGTGGGFPGIILSSVFKEFYFLLIDSIKKKILFHRNINAVFTNNNNRSLCGRVELLSSLKIFKGSFNFIFTRAVAEMGLLLELSIELLNSKGKFILMKKGDGISEELKTSKKIFKDKNICLKCIVNLNQKKNSRILLIGKKM